MSGGVVVADRELALKLLAESLYDFLPGPKGATFKKLSSKKQGASHYEPCLECGGTWLVGEQTGDKVGYRKGKGVKRDRFKREVPCEPCGGYLKDDGSIEPGAGVIGVDRMTEAKVGTEKTYAVVGKDHWPCNVCTPLGPQKAVKRGTGYDTKRKETCRACGGTGTREVSKGMRFDVADPESLDVTLNAFEAAIERRNQMGSYFRLEVCLAELAHRGPRPFHDIFHRVHVVKTASPGLLSPVEADNLRAAYKKLLSRGWMPQEIRVPYEIIRAAKRDPRVYAVAKGSNADAKAQEIRDDAIRELRRGGATIAELMADFNLGKSQVYEIVADVEAA